MSTSISTPPFSQLGIENIKDFIRGVALYKAVSSNYGKFVGMLYAELRQDRYELNDVNMQFITCYGVKVVKKIIITKAGRIKMFLHLEDGNIDEYMLTDKRNGSFFVALNILQLIEVFNKLGMKKITKVLKEMKRMYDAVVEDYLE